jgi:hypothetical protein
MVVRWGPRTLHDSSRKSVRLMTTSPCLRMEGWGVKLSVNDRGAAKRSALKSIKNLVRELPKAGATAAATKGGGVAWQQFGRALDGSYCSGKFLPPSRHSRTARLGRAQAGTEAGSKSSTPAAQGIICRDVSEFESDMPSHAVGLPKAVSPPVVGNSTLSTRVR